MDSSAAVPWENLLLAYLAGNSDLTPLYNATHKPLQQLVARIAPLIPEDVREEVVHQLFMRLIENPPKFDPCRCRPSTFTYGLVRNAARQVRAMYAPPGRKTRTGPEVAPAEKNQTARSIEVDQQPIADGRSVPEDLDEIPTRRWSPESICAFAQVSELLSQLPQDVAAAAWMVFGLEYSIIEAARIIRKSRFAIARSLRNAKRMTRAQAKRRVTAVLTAHKMPH
jgi:DNA-directed RNA polymerase specialized sigma24 family protein